MLKFFSLCAAFFAFTIGPLCAQEREANIQRITGPDDTFDVIVGTQKSGDAPIYDLGESPDALIIHLTGGELWIGFDDTAKMLETVEMLRRPISAFHAGDENIAVAVYLIPKARILYQLAPSN